MVIFQFAYRFQERRYIGGGDQLLFFVALNSTHQGGQFKVYFFESGIGRVDSIEQEQSDGPRDLDHFFDAVFFNAGLCADLLGSWLEGVTHDLTSEVEIGQGNDEHRLA